MSSKQDEQKFIDSYGENGVNFKNFSESSQSEDNCATSQFTLLREMSTIKEELEETDPSSPNSVMELIKGNEPKKKKDNEPKVNINYVAKPLRNRSSLPNFLKAGIDEDLIEDNFSQDQDDFPSLNNVRSKNNSTAPAPVSRNVKGYKGLFKSSDRYTNNDQNTDETLQSIYKRLLKCQ